MNLSAYADSRLSKSKFVSPPKISAQKFFANKMVQNIDIKKYKKDPKKVKTW